MHGAQSKEKIEQFMNRLIENFQVSFYPCEQVAIDEMVIGWKGHWKYKQYNASKPSKYIKTFGLCDSATGYCYNILTYYSKETSFDSTLERKRQAEKCLSTCCIPLEIDTMCMWIDTILHTL